MTLPPLSLWLAAARPFSFPCSLMAVLLGFAAAAPAAQWRLGPLAASLAAMLLLHVAANFMNDYYDYVNGVDRDRPEDAERPGRALVRGGITLPQLRRAILLCLAGALPLAAYLIATGGWPVAAFGLFGAAGAWAYTSEPVHLKRRGLGELAMIVWFGPASGCGAAWVQTHALNWPAALLSLPHGILVAAILAAGNLRDWEEDAAGGVRTMAHRLGRPAYRVLHTVLIFIPFAIVAAAILADMAPPTALAVVLALPLVVPPLRTTWRGERRPDADAVVGRYLLAFDALLVAGLLWGRAF